MANITNITGHLTIRSDLVESIYFVFAAVTLSWIPFIIIGNVLIIASTFIYKKLRKTKNYMLSSLAVADLLMGLFCIPMYATSYLAPRLIKDSGEKICCLWFASIQISGGASLHNLLLITLDRYIAVTNPFEYNNIMSLKRAKIYIAIVWIYNIVEAFLPFFGVNRYNPNEPNIDKRCNYYLTNHKLWVNWASFVHIGFSIGVSAILNIHIFCLVKKTARRLKQEKTEALAVEADSVTTYSHVATADPVKEYKQNIQTVRFTFIIFSIYIFFWIPYLMVAPLKYVPGLDADAVEVYKVISQLSNFFNAVINAPLYAYMRMEYRVAYRQLLTTNPCRWGSRGMVNDKLEGFVLVRRESYTPTPPDSEDDGVAACQSQGPGALAVKQSRVG